ncbi:MAG: hypothetical protein VR70_12270 [Rhodospirillaceae bacterium BRH_c57]|nr:MAG: hypothetical protein VR70_12270 [Rhodospirillaceae bacterium BRH_c57]
MFNIKPAIQTATTNVWLLTKHQMIKSGCHVGDAPANGPIPSLITDVIHKAPAPQRTHLSATSALGLVTRAMKKGKPIPPCLLDALAEAFAADVVDALAKAKKVKRPPKKEGKPYDRAKAEADCDWRVKAAEMLLRHYLVYVALSQPEEEGLVYWVGDATPKFSEDVAFTLRAQQGAEKMGIAHPLNNLTPNQATNAA